MVNTPRLHLIAKETIKFVKFLLTDYSESEKNSLEQKGIEWNENFSTSTGTDRNKHRRQSTGTDRNSRKISEKGYGTGTKGNSGHSPRGYCPLWRHCIHTVSYWRLVFALSLRRPRLGRSLLNPSAGAPRARQWSEADARRRVETRPKDAISLQWAWVARNHSCW